jgi:transposase
MEPKSRRKYDAEFKREAIRLAGEPGRTASSVERDLGIPQGSIYHWKAQIAQKGEHAFPGKGRQTTQEEELRRLRKEVESLREDRAILKKALAIFSKKPQ